jgi:hypothetical protein
MAEALPTADHPFSAIMRINLKAHHSAGHCLRRASATSLIVQLIGHIAHHVNIHDQAGADRNIAVLRQAVSILDR